MAKYTRAIVDQNLRDRIFTDIFDLTSVDGVEANAVWSDTAEYRRINDRQWGCILTDANGVKRYCRIGIIVAEEREDLTAEELMAQEIAAHQEKVAAREEKARAKAEKIARDKARREEQKKEEEE